MCGHGRQLRDRGAKLAYTRSSIGSKHETGSVEHALSKGS